jgi:hypothetical protein
MLFYGNNVDVLDSFAIVISPNKFNTTEPHLWVNLNTHILPPSSINNSGTFASITIKKISFRYMDMMLWLDHCICAHVCE